MIRRTAISGLMVLISPAFLWAQEPSNTISGTIGTLEVNVPIWNDQSDFHGAGNDGGVSILSRPVAIDKGFGAVSIGFEGSDFLSGDFYSFEIAVSDTAADTMSSYFANLDHGLQINITQAEKRDGVLSISGTVQGTLIWRQLMPISERKEDPSRELPVDLAFDVVLENEY